MFTWRAVAATTAEAYREVIADYRADTTDGRTADADR
jgi:hypothetical protein